MAQLPQELIVEILLLLPVKFLLRFRCLSKSFCAVIDSPNFINSHISKSSQNLNPRKLIFEDRQREKFHVCDVNVDLEEDILRLENPVSSPSYAVNGYCKGLFLLYRSKFQFALWNPSTRQYRDLPNCPLKVPADLFYHIIGTGLGYDDSIDDFKVFLKLTVVREIQVWIYELKSNIWRMSQNFPGLGERIDEDAHYFTDGSLHWLCFKEWNPKIVAFDVRKETFSVVPQPVRSVEFQWNRVPTKLHVLEGCLCISYVDGSNADLYIRKNDGVSIFTWTKVFSVTEPLFFDIRCFRAMEILGYSKRGDKILLLFGVDYMISYDLKKKSFGEVKINKDPNLSSPIPFLESLMSVGGGAFID